MSPDSDPIHSLFKRAGEVSGQLVVVADRSQWEADTAGLSFSWGDDAVVDVSAIMPMGDAGLRRDFVRRLFATIVDRRDWTAFGTDLVQWAPDDFSGVLKELGLLSVLCLPRSGIDDAYLSTLLSDVSPLTCLHLAENRLGSAAASTIAERLPGLRELHLDGAKIGDDGAAILANRLREVTNLSLVNCSISDDGARAIAASLHALIGLRVGGNYIGDRGAAEISSGLPALQLLCLNDNPVGDQGAIAISRGLNQLCELDLSTTHTREVGVVAVAQSLGGLISLGLRSCSAGDSGAMAISEGVPRLTRLDLGFSQIGVVGAKAISSGLKRLVELDLAGNEIGDEGAIALAENLKTLTRLHLSSNGIGDRGVAAIAAHLENLKTLDLEDNMIGDVGLHSIAEPLGVNAVQIVLSKNLITDISPLRAWLAAGNDLSVDRRKAVAGISISDNPLTIPPIEIAQQGREAILNFFREREVQGIDHLYEAKVLVLGEGRAGKTSLIRRMYSPHLPLPDEKDTTRGIDIHLQSFLLPNGRTFRLNVWDFGGQEIYHSTHQFFLTRRSLYVLVDDTAKNQRAARDEGFRYWLESVEVLADSSPVLIFQNEKGGRSKQIAIGGIRSQFPNVVDVFAGDLLVAGSADRLKHELEKQAQELPHVGEEVPAKWVAVRAEVERLARERPVIAEIDYLRICESHLGLDVGRARHLSRYFHDLGIFLHFQDSDLLGRMIVLRNDWATSAVFAMLDDEEIKGRRGLFTLDDCRRVWATPEYSDRLPELLELMVRFDLCYRIRSDERAWLMPQMLPPDRPPHVTQVKASLNLVYRYEYLPKGLISRLIVRLHHFVMDRSAAWADGVLLLHDGSRVLVELNQSGSEISLSAAGPQRKELLAVVASELDDLNDSYGGLARTGRVYKNIPCICTHCRSSDRPSMLDYRNLVQRRTDGQPTIECPQSYESANVLELLDGVNLRAKPEVSTQRVVPQPEQLAPGGRTEAVSHGSITISAIESTVHVGSSLQRHTDPLEGVPASIGPSLPDLIQNFAGAGMVVGAALAVAFGLGRGWDFTRLDFFYAVGAGVSMGTVGGAIAAFAVRLFRR